MVKRHLPENSLSKSPERALLVGVHLQQGRERSSTESSINELKRLVETAGGEPGGMLLQRREKPDRALFVGRGKAKEIQEQRAARDCDIVVFDNELTPTCQRNLEKTIGCKVIDRTELILDIFAQHAKTRDGKLQVELAQLRYRLPRLPGKGALMSRLGGGIGTRGPGETQIEIDRRRITERIEKLKKRLQKLRVHRSLQRKRRRRSDAVTVAIVGYTNAGKSTLMNLLSGAGVLTDDQLFATLDTTTRRIETDSGPPLLLTDTVGFIQNLPQNLLTAFRATLEEVTEANALLHVVDASVPDARKQIHAVLDVLDELGAGEKPILTVLNKVDRVEEQEILRCLRADFPPAVETSALIGVGRDRLFFELGKLFRQSEIHFSLVLPYSRQSLLRTLHEKGQVFEERFEPDGIRIRAAAPRPVYHRIMSVLEKTSAERPIEGGGETPAE